MERVESVTVHFPNIHSLDGGTKGSPVLVAGFGGLRRYLDGLRNSIRVWLIVVDIIDELLDVLNVM
jgi:hypothetical protein